MEYPQTVTGRFSGPDNSNMQSLPSPLRSPEDALRVAFDLYAKFVIPESEAYPHHKEVDGKQYHTLAFDPATTELEFLRGIWGLLQMFQPKSVLELGTGCGLGSFVILAALSSLSVPVSRSLVTVDTRYLPTLRNLLSVEARHGSKYPEFFTHQADANGWCKLPEEKVVGCPGLYDFVVSDTVQEFKVAQIADLYTLNRLLPGAVIVFHDTSPTRITPPAGHHLDYLHALEEFTKAVGAQRLDVPYSRGLTIMRLPDKV